MRKIYLLLLILPCVLFGQKLQGQKLIDSLLVELPKMKEDTLKVNLLNSLAFELKYFEPKKNLYYSEKAIKLAKNIKFDEGISTAYKNLGIYYGILANEKMAVKNLSAALKFAVKKASKAKVYSTLGVLYNSVSKVPIALENNLKAIKIFEEINDIENIVTLYTNIAGIYFGIQDYQKAIFYFKKSLSFNSKKQNEKQYTLCNIGLSYIELNKYVIALEYLNKSLIGLQPSETSENHKAYVYKGLGEIYLKTKKLDKAEIAFKNALKQTDENGQAFLAEIFLNLGIVYFEKSQISNNNTNNYLNISKLNIEKSIEINKKINNDLNSLDQYKLLSNIQKLQGNYKEALLSHEKYVVFKDSVFNSENKETIKNLEDKREIELRDKQIKINKLSLDAKEKQKWYLFGGLGLLTIIGGLLFYQSRKRKQINEKLQVLNENLDIKNTELDQANKAKTRFFSILNHDLRGPVNNLIFFLQLQKESPEMLDEESTKRMQDKTMTGAENLLASMEDILQWSKSQMENFKPQPKKVLVSQLFEDTKKVFSGYMNIRFEYQNPDNIEIFTDDNYLKTIIRNLTSNAINVFTNTEKPLIIWKAWQENTISYLSISDNGPGAEAEKLKALFIESEVSSSKSGLGLHLIRDMAKAIDCEISVNSENGFGTIFILQI